MKSFIVLFIPLFVLSNNVFSQDPAMQACTADYAFDYLHGNNVRAIMSNSGTLFFDGSGGGFEVPFDNSGSTPSPLFGEGLWIGGFSDGNLKTAAMTYGTVSGDVDFWPGPLDENGMTENENCSRWNHIWSVRRQEIEAHIADYLDNQVINNLPLNLMKWPGKGNPYFESIFGFSLPNAPQGLAPFYDRDGDGIYNPLAGDYPWLENVQRIPEQIIWAVFNDQGGGAIHGETNGEALNVEVQLTAWVFNCADNPVLNNTVFTSHKIINKGNEVLDSLHVGFFDDHDLGCYPNDGIGSSPSLDSYFAYQLPIDTSSLCPFDIWNGNAPVLSVTFLNRSMDNFIVLGTACTQYAQTDVEYFKLLTGQTFFGHLTYGEDGCNPNNPPASFAFPGNPNVPGEWSMLSAQLPQLDYRPVASTKIGKLAPGEFVVLEAARGYHRGQNSTTLENVTLMYDEVGQIRTLYNQHFATGCQQPFCANDCVWPGDANHDGIANHCDLLPIGLHLGKTGPQRPNSYFWAPFTAANWSGNQPGNVNHKHADADGNGEVNSDDFKMTILNYNSTIPNYQSPVDVYQVGPELYLESAPNGDFDHVIPGHNFFGRVKLVEVPDLFGISFQMDYDPRYFKQIKPFGQSYSTYNDNLSYGSKARIELSYGEFDIAAVRTSLDSVIKSGTLITLDVIPHDTYEEPLPSNTTPIRFKNIKAIRSDGSIINIGGMTKWATFEDVPVSDTKEKDKIGLTLFPNPASQILTVSFPGEKIGQVTIYNTGGKLIYLDKNSHVGQFTTNLEDLKPGLYFLRVSNESGSLITKFVVAPK